jgi:error-prone DNA polymerase
MSPSYAELHCLTNFSFLRGASHPEELVERAAQLGYSALAITDECSLAGVVRAHVAAKEHGIKLIVGCEVEVQAEGEQGKARGKRLDARGKALRADPSPRPSPPRGEGEQLDVSSLNGHASNSPPLASSLSPLTSRRLPLALSRLSPPASCRLVLLACNRDGYGNLSELITLARRRSKKGEYRLTLQDLDEGLPGCLALLLPGKDLDPAHAAWLKARFPQRCWIAAELLYGANDAARLDVLEGFSRVCDVPLAAASDVHMHVRARRALQDTLTAVRLKRPLSECGAALFPNGERHLRSRERLLRIYPPELLIATLDVADRCSFSLDELRYEYPEEIVPQGETPASWLRKLACEGFRWRFGAELDEEGERREARGERSAVPPLPLGERVGVRGRVAGEGLEPEGWALRADPSPQPSPPRGEGEKLESWGGHFTAGQKVDIAKARTLVEHELALIAELRYEPYFLTVYDVVGFARSQGILCQGRGSAANSAVCYCLGVTEVDPARMEMLFERFISKERNEPPDIDVDFEHERREEVIQYIYRKYGRERAAIAATVISYRSKSAVRDIGKALGLDLAQVDRLAKNLAFGDVTRIRPERIRECGFDPDSPVIQRLLALVHVVIGFPRHLSQHVGGFVISRGPVSRLVPVENAAMPERTIIQWDKDDLDALGLLKVDVLALGMLTAIRRALHLVSEYRGRPVSMSDVPAEDPGVYEMVGRADTIGVFQIESRAQQAMLPRMRPNCFYDLVIEVAIVRPGPIQGGMIHPYLRRRQGLEPVTYPSDAVRGVLERTLGVPIFQEQVMQLAIVAAGFTPGEADKLRRAMAAWKRRGGLEPFEKRLKEGMRERGYSDEFAQQIFQQILGFGEYGFPESHSASFALLVYVSCWLKCYEPAAFTCALLNSQPMGFYAPAQLVQDAQRHGVQVLPPDVLVSGWDCALEARGERREARGTERSADGSKIGTPGCAPEARGERREARGTEQSADGSKIGTPGCSPSPLRGEGWGEGEHCTEHCKVLHASPAIRLGLRMVKGFSKEAAERLVAARERLLTSRPDSSFRGREAAPGIQEMAREQSVTLDSGGWNDARALSLTPHPRPLPQGEREKTAWVSDVASRAQCRSPSPFGGEGKGPAPDLIRGEGCRSPSASSLSFEHLALAANLNRHDVNALAAAGALASITGHRRQAAWDVTGIHPRPPVLAGTLIDERVPQLLPPTEADDIVADYATLGLTLGRHPLALLRPRLTRMRMATAAQIRDMPQGRLTRAAGLVIGRQRPDTASGVIFVTLEDETGMVNVVVWRTVSESQRRELLGSHLMAVHGVIERQGEVVHLVAGRLVDHSHLLGGLLTRSRDFH